MAIKEETLAAWEESAKHLSGNHTWCGKSLLQTITEIRRLREAPLDFTGHDHPEANGQRPTPGAFEWTFSFTLEDGRTLKVHVGERGFRAFEEMFLKNRAADYQERDQLKADLAAHRAVARAASFFALCESPKWVIPSLQTGQRELRDCDICRGCKVRDALAHPLVQAGLKEARPGGGR